MGLRMMAFAAAFASVILALIPNIAWLLAAGAGKLLKRSIPYAPFGWTPASWMFKQTDGRYDIDGQTLYINIGLGCTAPVRIGANPEITLITLKSNL